MCPGSGIRLTKSGNINVPSDCVPKMFTGSYVESTQQTAFKIGHYGRPYGLMQQVETCRQRTLGSTHGKHSPCHQHLHHHQGNHEHRGNPNGTHTHINTQTFSHLAHLRSSETFASWDLKNKPFCHSVILSFVIATHFVSLRTNSLRNTHLAQCQHTVTMAGIRDTGIARL